VAARVGQGVVGRRRRAAGAAEAPHVRRDHPEAVLGEERDLVPPQVGRIGPAMDEHNGRALAVVLHVQGYLVDLGDLPLVSSHAKAFSNSSRDGPGGANASWPSAAAITRSPNPGRLSTSSGSACIEMNSIMPRNTSGS